MHRSIKAALLSGVVFPGLGQLYLKRPLRALLFLLPAAIAVYYFSSGVLEPLLAIAHDITTGALELDPVLVQQRVDASRVDSTMMNVAMWVMIAAWVGATVDAWLIGRQPDPSRQTTT